ncbi:MAG: (deoxy)nucleoside triphosphate pyrophosphohydrolase [Cellvibrionales bacterium]|nr:(deoxy)nucleoside triphosphate pyrophosphohydrolase [Cellvibrionales bacterium]
MSDSVIHVVAGIIWSQDKSQILITQRPKHLHKGGYWEFPGGKVEPLESCEAALARELFEELAICFTSECFFQSIQFDYPEKTVKIDFYEVFDLLSEPSPQEQQDMCWVSVSELGQYAFPEANQAVVTNLMQSKG